MAAGDERLPDDVGLRSLTTARGITAVFATAAVALHLLTWQAVQRIELRPDIVRPRFAGDWFWGGWNLWDGEWYLDIAANGYSYTPGEQSSVAFFPGYPMLVRAVGAVFDNHSLGGIAITVLCGLASLLLLREWTRRRISSPAVGATIALLAAFPYAYYLYGTVYSDAMFLALALGAFLLAESDRPVLAGLLGAATTATRLVGVAVVVGLVLIVLERRGALTWSGRRPRLDLSTLRRRDAGVLLSAGGLAGWSIYLWHRFGDPFLFSTVQEAWGQPLGLRTLLKLELFEGLPDKEIRYSIGCLVQGGLAIAALASAPAVARRFGLAYAAYVVILVVLPTLGSQDFQGLGRYLLGAFPCFALVGSHLGSRPALARRILAVSGVFLVFQTVLFVKGEYVA